MKRLLQIVNNLSKLLYHIANVGVILVCTMITLDIILQVFFRYVLNNSLQWSEETGVYLMIWMVFLGCSLLMRNEEHIRVNAILRRLPAKLKVSLTLLFQILGITFLILVAYYGLKVFASGTAASSPSLGISTKWVKLSIPVGAILMIVHSFYLFIDKVGRVVRGDLD